MPTLAEHLRAQGFDTVAFVGPFVLDRRFGLARGFGEYWGEFPLYRYKGLDPGTIQFRGDRVEQAAAEWIAHHRLRPFFAFVHFYDPCSSSRQITEKHWGTMGSKTTVSCSTAARLMYL